MIFELVSGDMNKVMLAQTEMKNRGDKTVFFIVCKFSTNCAQGRLFIFWECMLWGKRILFMNCFSLFRKTNDCRRTFCTYENTSFFRATNHLLP